MHCASLRRWSDVDRREKAAPPSNVLPEPEPRDRCCTLQVAQRRLSSCELQSAAAAVAIHLIELMDTHGPDLLTDHVRVSATWSQTSRRRYQLCAPVLTASALHPHTRHPQPFPTFARAYVRLAPAPAGTSTLFLNLPLRLLQMERRLLPSSRERHRAPYSSVLG